MDNIPEIIRCPPVLVCGFARPDTLKLVFDRIKEVKPSKLYLWLNCPRADRPDEVARNLECKKIFSDVQWPCDVHRNYSPVYLECRDSLEKAFTWFFDNVDRGIVLEDDCVPDPTFFRFCGELLEKYKDDGRVGMISGHLESSHVSKMETYGASYYFDRCASIWGWATWRRAWRMHDPLMQYHVELDRQFDIMYGFYRDWPCVKRRKKRMWQLYDRSTGSWDGAWFTTVQIENWLVVHPFVNLVTNVGCGKSSRVETAGRTDTAKRRVWYDCCPTTPMSFPLVAPLTMMPNPFAEKNMFIDVFNLNYKRWWLKNAPIWAMNKIKRLVGHKEH